MEIHKNSISYNHLVARALELGKLATHNSNFDQTRLNVINRSRTEEFRKEP